MPFFIFGDLEILLRNVVILWRFFNKVRFQHLDVYRWDYLVNLCPLCLWWLKQTADIASLASKWPGGLLQLHLRSWDMGWHGRLWSSPSLFSVQMADFLHQAPLVLGQELEDSCNHWASPCHSFAKEQTHLQCVQDEAMPSQSLVWEYSLIARINYLVYHWQRNYLVWLESSNLKTSQFHTGHDCVSWSHCGEP